MVTLMEARKRVNDCAVQTRCDKRTIATLTQWSLEERGYVISMSELVRTALERLEEAILTKMPDLEILSSEEANDLIERHFDATLHPRRTVKGSGRQVPTYNYSYRKQLDLEDALMEDRAPEYGRERTLKMIEKGTVKVTPEMVVAEAKRIRQADQEIVKRKTRMPDNVVADDPDPDLQESTERQAKQTKDENAALAGVPGDIITEEEE